MSPMEHASLTVGLPLPRYDDPPHPSTLHFTQILELAMHDELYVELEVRSGWLFLTLLLWRCMPVPACVLVAGSV